jgi:putative two-component system response regulator
MPEMDGYEAIQKLKSTPGLAEIPVIFLTAKSDDSSELKGLSLGAIDYVSKPFSAPILLKRIKNYLLIATQKAELQDYNDNLEKMVHKKTEQVTELQNAILKTVAEMVEFRDDVTGGHIDRTQKYLRLLVDKLVEADICTEEVGDWDLDFLIPSAQLHDVGKIAVRDNILNKPGKLTDEEFAIIKRHSAAGVVAIEKIAESTREHSFLNHAKIFAGTHHEKWDGTGYPLGLSHNDIPLQGRLMAIADVYDALISTRPYKASLSTKEAEEIIIAGKGTHFDPMLVDIFTMVADEFARVAESYRNR